MRDDRFEWDDRKAAANLRKHDISFQLARLAFDDPFGIDEIEDDPDEERWARIAMVRDVLLYVVHTQRGNRVRIITARKADRDEQDKYFRQG